MNSRRVSFLVAAAACVALGLNGCSSGGGTGDAHGSPAEAFSAMKTAGSAEDWKGICDTLTDESVEAFAGSVITMSSMAETMLGMAALGGGDTATVKESKEALAKVKTVLANHGVKMGPGPTDPAEMLADVKDRSALMADLMPALEGVNKKAGVFPVDFASNAKLVDLEVTGDGATGSVEYEGKKDPIAFKKSEGGWKIDLLPLFEKGMKSMRGMGGGVPGGLPAGLPSGLPGLPKPPGK